MGGPEECKARELSHVYALRTVAKVSKAMLQPPSSCNVYTPKCLANAMVKAIGDPLAFSWLEPCVGRGVFLESLRDNGIKRKQITAIDLDRRHSPADSFAHVIRGTEFLNWAGKTKLRFDRIIGNPPYIALGKVAPAVRDAALRVSDPDGKPLTLGCNCWYAFLCAAIRLLKPGGGLALVLPAAFEFADYASRARALLPEWFSRFEVHRSRTPVFDTVQDGSVVVVATGYGNEGSRTVRHEYENVRKLICGLEPRKRKAGTGKTLLPARTKGCAKPTVRLGDVVTIGLGAVTGDVQYFLMTETDRKEWRLPLASLRAVVSRACHLSGSEVSVVEWMRLLNRDERIWLFRPSLSALNYPAVQKYLKYGRRGGGCELAAYKIQARDPWYRPAVPRQPHGFVTGMSQYGPWICLNRMPSLVATNTLYTIRFRRHLSENERFAWALTLLTTGSRQQLLASPRMYAQGLLKYEPGDLAALRVVSPTRVRGARASYRRAVAALLAGHSDESQKIADGFLDV